MISQLITFENSERVIQAERKLKQLQISVQARPTPRILSNECGICLQVYLQEKVLKELLKQHQLQPVRHCPWQE